MRHKKLTSFDTCLRVVVSRIKMWRIFLDRGGPIKVQSGRQFPTEPNPDLLKPEAISAFFALSQMLQRETLRLSFLVAFYRPQLGRDRLNYLPAHQLMAEEMLLSRDQSLGTFGRYQCARGSCAGNPQARRGIGGGRTSGALRRARVCGLLSRNSEDRPGAFNLHEDPLLVAAIMRVAELQTSRSLGGHLGLARFAPGAACFDGVVFHGYSVARDE